jgi:acyl-CoA dehydrogenase
MRTLLSYVDAGFCCPVSMTTGAALVLEPFAADGRLGPYFDRLTPRETDDHIGGAMFLTEKQGGSDVGANQVRAEPTDDPEIYELHGEKWFCSNIDTQEALALARPRDTPAGTEGLSMFLVPHTRPDGTVNDSRFRRLKNKLGTRAVPTEEVVFEGAEAYLVGEEGEGVRRMTRMMNYERLTKATGALGVTGRALLEAKVHAANREAFGRPIEEYPLLRRDLVEMTVDYEAAAAFTFEAARLLGRYRRSGDRDEDYRLMRLLVPVAKYRTAEKSVETASDTMEVLGGNGYVNGFVTEWLLRDAQVLPIWEGTSNVLSLDLLRVLDREEAAGPLFARLEELLAVSHPYLDLLASAVRDRVDELGSALRTLAGEDREHAQYHPKRLADLSFDVVAAALLVSEAATALSEAGDGRKPLVAASFVRSRFEEGPAYGVAGGDRPGTERYDAIARYGGVDPSTLGDARRGSARLRTRPRRPAVQSRFSSSVRRYDRYDITAPSTMTGVSSFSRPRRRSPSCLLPPYS